MILFGECKGAQDGERIGREIKSSGEQKTEKEQCGADGESVTRWA